MEAPERETGHQPPSRPGAAELERNRCTCAEDGNWARVTAREREVCFESCKQVIPMDGIAETMDFQQGKYSVTVDYQSNEWIPVPG